MLSHPLLKTFNKDNFIAGISDGWFYLAKDAEYRKVIKQSPVNRQLYVPEIGDCDNFAFELRGAFGRKGWCCGILYVKTSVGYHAIFFYITDQRKVVIIEPQNDEEYTDITQTVGIIMY